MAQQYNNHYARGRQQKTSAPRPSRDTRGDVPKGKQPLDYPIEKAFSRIRFYLEVLDAHVERMHRELDAEKVDRYADEERGGDID